MKVLTTEQIKKKIEFYKFLFIIYSLMTIISSIGFAKTYFTMLYFTALLSAIIMCFCLIENNLNYSILEMRRLMREIK